MTLWSNEKKWREERRLRENQQLRELINVSGKSPYKYFSLKEASGLVPDLMFKLDRARELYGFPIVITSGFRTPEENERVHGVPNSAHLSGKAADLQVSQDIFIRMKMVWALGRAGFCRVFVYLRHIHVDVDYTKPHPAFGERQYL